MSKEITLNYYGMSGTGPTVKEAKAAAGAKLEAWVKDDHNPVLLNWRGTLLVMSRDAHGWGYRMYDLADLKTVTFTSHCSCGMGSRSECLLAAVKHLADIKRQYGERTCELFGILHRTTEMLRIERDFAADAERQDQFRDRHRFAVEVMKLPSNTAHNWAGMNPYEYELWQGTERIGKDYPLPTPELLDSARKIAADPTLSAMLSEPRLTPIFACLRSIEQAARA